MENQEERKAKIVELTIQNIYQPEWEAIPA